MNNITLLYLYYIDPRTRTANHPSNFRYGMTKTCQINMSNYSKLQLSFQFSFTLYLNSIEKSESKTLCTTFTVRKGLHVCSFTLGDRNSLIILCNNINCGYLTKRRTTFRLTQKTKIQETNSLYFHSFRNVIAKIPKAITGIIQVNNLL